jgi:hypothetical protein
MSWLDAVPAVLLSAVWLFVPGLFITYALGLRSFAAWGLAPVMTVALAATTAVVAQKVGVRWSIGLIVIVSLVIAVLVGVVSLALRRKAPPMPADPRRVTLAAAIGLVPALILGAISLVRGIIRPDALSQTYDAVLHYNAVAAILDTGRASSLTMGNLDVPGDPNTFYPGAWHDLTSLVALSGGFSIPLSVNMISWVIGVVVWPVGCMLLVRQVIGRSAVGLAITGVVSVAFSAFPWGLLSFGVLWPNLLGLAITPAILALVISITGLAREDPIGKGRAWLMLPVALVAAGFAHPNSIFGVIALSIFPVFISVGSRALRLRAEGKTWEGVTEFVVALVVFLAFWRWASVTPVFAGVRQFFWAPFATPAQAVGEVLFQSNNRYNALWFLALVTLGGLLLCRRNAPLRWVAGGFAVSGFLYVMAAAFNRPDTQKFTGFWYNDSHRLAAMLPVTAVPLAVASLMYLGTRVAAFSEERGWLTPARDPHAETALDGTLTGTLDAAPRSAWLALRGRSFAVSTLVVTVLLGLLTGGFYVNKHAAVLNLAYVIPSSQPSLELVNPDTEKFFEQIKKDIPPDEMVANNPWDGSALLWALADRRVLFPHLGISIPPDAKYLAQHLDDALTDPQVCQIANKLHVGYLYIGDNTFWPWDKRTKTYPGFADPGSSKAFQLIASSGPELKLYQLTACTKGT